MKSLLTVSAIVELLAGLLLIATPSLVSSLLFSTPIEKAVGFAAARLIGVALFSLGVACWFGRLQETRAAAGIVTAMLIYDLGAAAVFAYARLGYGIGGLVLWAVVLLHSLLGVWCIVALRSAQRA